MNDKNWPGMKEKQFRQHMKCTNCSKKIMEGGIPLFYTLKIERWGIDMNAVRRQSELEMMMGGHVAIAQAMGPDEDLAKAVMDPLTVTICEKCSMDTQCIPGLVEMAMEGK